MDRGYVRLWRKTLDSGLLQHPTALQVFMYLLLSATRTSRKLMVAGQVFELGPGDYATSVAGLCEALKLSPRQCRTALSVLEKLEIVAIKTTNKGSLISLVNWDTYQQERPAERQTGDKQATSTRQTPDKPIEQELNNINTLTPVSNDTSVSVAQKSASNRPKEGVLVGKRRRLEGKRARAFEQFWEVFAYKKGKAQAIDAWAAIPQLTDALMEQILAAAKREAERRPEAIAAGRTPIYAQGWISGRRWEDEELAEAGPWKRPDWMYNPDYDWDEHERRERVQLGA